MITAWLRRVGMGRAARVCVCDALCCCRVGRADVSAGLCCRCHGAVVVMSGTGHSGQCTLNEGRGVAGLADICAEGESGIGIDDALDVELVKCSSRN